MSTMPQNAAVEEREAPLLVAAFCTVARGILLARDPGQDALEEARQQRRFEFICARELRGDDA